MIFLSILGRCAVLIAMVLYSTYWSTDQSYSSFTIFALEVEIVHEQYASVKFLLDSSITLYGRPVDLKKMDDIFYKMSEDKPASIRFRSERHTVVLRL